MKLNFIQQSNLEWTAPSTFPDLSSAKTIAIDLETCDTGMDKNGPGWPTKNGFICGYALAVDGWSGYFPVAHEGGGNLDKKRVERFIQEVLNTPADKVMFNASYDLGWLLSSGYTVNGTVYDAMIVASLLDENRLFYNLNSVGRDYVGEFKSEEKLREAAAEFGFHHKRDLWRLPAMYVGEYAEQDAALTLKVWEAMQREIVRHEIRNVFELETELLPILVNMTMKGIRFDMNKAEQTLDMMRKKEKLLLKELNDKAGIKVDIWAAASIAKAFDNLNLRYTKTAKGSPSFTKTFLNTHPHPIAKLIVDIRELNKASGTFVEKLMEFGSKTGRIHPHINPVKSDEGGTVTGRFSMNNPNLQQIPARHPEIGPLIRGLFVPEEGEKWASLDFSQQEPRIAVHYASLYKHPGAKEAAEKYINDPDTDFHQMVADLAGIPRKQAKTIGLGLMYGMGKNKMALELDMSPQEAGVLIGKFHDKVPFLKGMISTVQERIDRGAEDGPGSITTLLGRKCRFPLWEPVGYGLHKPLPLEDALREYGKPLRRAYSYKGLNRLIQGSAADQTKKAMIDCYKDGGQLPLLQIHDELCFSVESQEVAENLKTIMENCVKLEVPSKVDLEMGDSWGEAE